MQVSMDLPESAFSVLKTDPDSFVKEMRLAAAVKWYEVQMVSQSKASELAGVSRAEFLDALRRYRVSPVQVTSEQLEEEYGRG